MENQFYDFNMGNNNSKNEKIDNINNDNFNICSHEKKTTKKAENPSENIDYQASNTHFTDKGKTLPTENYFNDNF